MTSSPQDSDLPAFSAGAEQLLERAGDLCRRNGTKLTPLRRQVLGILLEAGKPAGAYDILTHLQACHAGAAPPTVYRALDFLLEQGLIHKIERLSSFVPCTHILDHHGCDHEGEGMHATQFLICRTCGGVTELEDSGIIAATVQATRSIGFRVQHSTVEIEGLCASCIGA
ncbi:transcriptional repressor [Acetobacter sp. AN02]|uniref:Fur family transcriptional regulator n=1 Tax=Acetobacter sp. AN02 TaxID=2894186 RepID=UPI0024343FFD|nr:transcriptional repressor [Acetobacter sp. AN02]MDG6095620.1 transcriptional repressor [Acetobacter sp. AN02]